jgi:Gluconate 2-dehydrogenase subunit 3
MSDDKIKLNRRGALKLIATTAVAVPAIGCAVNTGGNITTTEKTLSKGAINYSPSDPDLNNPIIPWEFVLEKKELVTLEALADVIIPADDKSPSAGSLGAQDYINEWVSAPYDRNKKDLVLVRGGVVWINGESQRCFDKLFAELNEQQRQVICDDIKWTESAKPEFVAGARFFSKIRSLTATAFYTTEQGMADIGYVGNRPSVKFEGPPAEVLTKLGLNDLV